MGTSAQVTYNAYVMAAIHTRDYYRLSPQEALRALNTKKTGLTAEAVAESRPNNVQPPRVAHPATLYAKHYLTLPIALLALGSLAAYAFDNNAAAAILLALVFLNATVSWLQKTKLIQPSLSFDSLPEAAIVVRSGEMQTIPLAELLVGDIVYLEKGMEAPADIRLIEEDKLFVNDGLLTGDNTPKRKSTQAIQGHCPVTMQHNTVLAGSSITAGNAIGVAYAVGNDTEVITSTHQTQTAHQQSSPLHHTTERLSMWTTIGAVGLGAIAVPVAIATGAKHEDAVLYAVALLVAIAPISLLTILHLALTHARSLLRRHNAVATSPAAIDRLSTVNAVISDVSGVLSQRAWKPAYLYTNDQVLAYDTKAGLVDKDNKTLPKAMKQHAELLCTAALLTSQSRTRGQQTMAGAVASLAIQAGIQLQHIDKLYREIRFFAFDAVRQRASSLRYYGDKKSQKPHLFTTGSPDAILERCAKIWENGKTRKLTAEDTARIQKQYRMWTKQTLHTIGVAYRVMPANTKGAHLTNDTAETELVWLGLAAFANPLREHLANAIAATRSAHIKLSLVTDATPAVAKAMAIASGLAHSAKELTVITGESLARLSNTHVMHALQRGNALFVHLSPQDKHRLVNLAKQGGKIVAITGRGLTDTPALARADVGISLAATTTTTPSSTDLVLLDDNYATIVYGIKESRATSRNLATILRAYMTRSVALAALLITSLVANVAWNIPLAITVLHILVFILAIELLPLAAVGRDKPEQDLMKHSYHNSYRGLFTRSNLTDILWAGSLVTVLAYTNYILFFSRYDIPAGNVPTGSLLHAKATTLALLVVVLCQLANIVHVRSSNGIFSKQQLHNRSFWLGTLFALTAVTALAYNAWLGNFFGTAPLTAVDWTYALGSLSIFVAVREMQRFNKKHSRKAVLELHRTHRTRLQKI